MTYDGGENWKQITAEDGLPKGDLGRIGLAIAANRPNIVYALVEAKENALYKSTDGGLKWSKISTHENMGNRPFYYSEIYVDPQNENRVYSLWTYLSKSEDGGKTFDIIADYGNSVHPDHHAFWIHPEDPSYLINGNDGGLNFSYDMGTNWRFVNNLPVGQFYHVNVDDDFPYNVYGGMQDNGSWVGPAFTLKRGGITNHDWQEVFFGDGFDVAPLPSDNRYVFAMSQGGNIGMVDKLTGVSRFIKPNSADTVALRYNWNAPLALDPNNDCGLYYGSQFVHYSDDCGESWTIISPDLTTNDTSKQHQDISGGLTIDATNAENNTTLIAIAPSAVEEGVIWAGSDDGRLHITRDGGDSWTDVYGRLPGAPVAGWIPQIRTSAKNAGEAWVVVNNYRQNDWTAYLYHTNDYGRSWSRKVDDSDVSSFVTSVIQDEEEPNLVFLGTDAGLYISFDYGSSWHKWDQGFPSVQIRDLAIQSEFGDLVLGTFGRAFWVIDDIGAFREMARDSYVMDDVALVSQSPAYLSQFRSYQGIRFYGQAEFVGDNKDTDPVYSIWVKPNTDEEKKMKQEEVKGKKGKKKSEEKNETEENGEKKKKDKKEDQIQFVVLDMDGDTIRIFKKKISKEKGLQRMSWNLQRDGVRYPSRRDPRPDSDGPTGGSVLPGTYKVVLSHGEWRDSVMTEVKMDPRVDFTTADKTALEAAQKQFEEKVEMATEQYTEIKEARKTIALVEKLIETVKDTTQKELKEITKSQKEKLDELELMYMDKEGLKGIQRNPNNLNAIMRTARRYISASYGAPTPNAVIAINRAEDEINTVVSVVKDYFNTDWQQYQEKIEAVDFSIFK